MSEPVWPFPPDAELISEPCPRQCGAVIYGTAHDIDSGIRHHLDGYCPEPSGDESEE